MDEKRPKRENRLNKEHSPYLLQHADNPVDWHPWSKETFSLALKEDKPVFLSIGYSTCHWCHVMARESFEDEETARLLNNAFVCIKVDREERPDIDTLYMAFAQSFTGRGGWPLTIVMTPEKVPFFAATYIPKETRFGMTGLKDLIPRLVTLWKTQRQEISSSSKEIAAALTALQPDKSPEFPGKEAMDACYSDLLRQYDHTWGGFGTSQKFPSPHILLFLITYSTRGGQDKAHMMVDSTIRAIRSGGIYDHIGFGLHRYTTDREWRIPHFEKMLYDQALLINCCTNAFQTWHEKLYSQIADECIEYVAHNLWDPRTGFFTAEDAESGGKEGEYYLWTYEDFSAALPEEYRVQTLSCMDISPGGNIRNKEAGLSDGTNILRTRRKDPVCILPTAREALSRNRNMRKKPYCDKKVLCDMNGLMIASCARAGAVLNNQDALLMARSAAEFILSEMKGKDGRLFHRHFEGHTGIRGMLADYSYLIWGLLELYEATFDLHYLSEAHDLMETVLNRFRDTEKGGFFLAPDDSEDLLIRQKDLYDGAIPSALSVCMYDLVLLSRLSGDLRYEEAAWSTSAVYSESLRKNPSAYTFFLHALDSALGPSPSIVILAKTEEDAQPFVTALRREYIPGMTVAVRYHGEEGNEDLPSMIPHQKEITPLPEKTTAYICWEEGCTLPVTEPEEMMKKISNQS